MKLAFEKEPISQRAAFLVWQMSLFSLCLASAIRTTAGQDTPATNIVVNPSFERLELTGSNMTKLETTGHLSLNPGSTAIPGWVIGGGGVSLLYNVSVNVISNGNVSLLLANNGPGWVRQTINTTAGRAYSISFTAASPGLLDCIGPTEYKVTAGSMKHPLYYDLNSTQRPQPYYFFGFSFVADSQASTVTFNTTGFQPLTDIDRQQQMCAVVLDAITISLRRSAFAEPGNLVRNGGFEQDPSFPDADVPPDGFDYSQLYGLEPVVGWRSARPSLSVFLVRSIGNVSTDVVVAKAMSGSYSFMFPQWLAGISQEITTVPGKSYQLSFNVAKQGIIDTCKTTYDISASLGSTSQTRPLQASSMVFNMTADSYSSSMTLAIFSNVTSEASVFPYCGPLLDDVFVTEIGPAPSPRRMALTPQANPAAETETIEFALEQLENSQVVSLSDVTNSFSKLKQDGRGNSVLLLTDLIGPETGSALYAKPFHLFDRGDGRVASFSTNFTLTMERRNKSSNLGDHGLAFVLRPDAKSQGLGGESLGFAHSPDAAIRTFGVEFDTYLNPNVGDINGGYDDFDGYIQAHHVGLNNGSVISLTAAALDPSILLNTGEPRYCWISFDGLTQVMRVWVSNTPVKATATIQAKVDLKTLLDPFEWFYVGFCASTEANLQSHKILSWNFQSSISKSAPSRKNGSKAAVILGVTIPVVAVVFISIAFMVYFWDVRRRKSKFGLLNRTSTIDELGRSIGPPRFTYVELRTATKDFSTPLGRGGQGSVYMGTLDNGLQVAVKVFDIETDSREAEKVFQTEALTLGSLRHRNLCQLVGWCADVQRKKLICCYEYMQKGSLDMWLFAPCSSDEGKASCLWREPLSWSTRYNIAIGLARALAYLHEGAMMKVIHRDVKPGNIMLDESFNTRLGDFGLAFSTGHNTATMESRTAKGTHGYLPPEAFFSRKATEKWDVFAFGIVALELVSGRRSVEVRFEEGKKSLLVYMWTLVEEDRQLDITDERLQGAFDPVQVQKLISIALACTIPTPAKRPTMRQVVQVLTVEGESIEPIQVPTTRPTELTAPEVQKSVVWSTTNILGTASSSGVLGRISESSLELDSDAGIENGLW